MSNLLQYIHIFFFFEEKDIFQTKQTADVGTSCIYIESKFRTFEFIKLSILGQLLVNYL